MKFENINKKFTEMVNGYINKGYYFNAGTMDGSQTDEIAKVDLTNGKEIIRVVTERKREQVQVGALTDLLNKIVVKAGRVGEKCNKNVNRDCEFGSTIWNSELEVLEIAEYYEVQYWFFSRSRDKYYGTREEALEALEKRMQRNMNRYINEDYEMPEKAKAIALRWLKKQKGYKSAKMSDIAKNVRVVVQGTGAHRYEVFVKGNWMTIA